MTENKGFEIAWDGEIENDSPDFVTLPEGDYKFEVVKFERARHNGSEKLPPCNKAIVHLKIEGAEGISIIKHNLFLYSTCEGMLCAFFTAIGQRKHGERLKMNWQTVVGSKGSAKIGIRKWTNESNGKEYTANEVTRFYDFDKQPQLPEVQQELPWPEAPAKATPPLPYEPGVF